MSPANLAESIIVLVKVKIKAHYANPRRLVYGKVWAIYNVCYFWPVYGSSFHLFQQKRPKN